MGKFCAACGQRDLPAEPPLHELLGEAWGEFVNVDGKVMATLRLLLLRPGELTRQYLSGHRARFMPPLRLYLTCTLAFFLVNAAMPTRTPRPTTARRPTPAVVDSSRLARLADTVHAGFLARRLARNSARVAADQHNFSDDFAVQMPRALFVIMPAFALLLAAAYRSRERRYAAHLIVSLHLHAFMFATLAATVLVEFVRPRPLRIALMLALWMWAIAYIPSALRRVYGGGWAGVIVRAGGLVAAYVVLLVAAVAAIGVLLVLTY